MEDLINLLINSDLKLISKATGIPYDRMYKWTKGKSRPKIEDYQILTNYFDGKTSTAENVTSEPDISYETIVSAGKTILKPKGTLITSGTNRRTGAALIPFYNADFMAGAAETFYEDGVIYPEYYMDVPEFAGCTAFRAYSDSMEKRIRSGSILFGVKLEDWRSHLEFGQIYGVTTTDFRRYLKYVRKNKADERKLLLKSENPDYDDFTIPKDKIKNIWLIEGWLDKRT